MTSNVVEMWQAICHGSVMANIRSPRYCNDDIRRIEHAKKVFDEALSNLLRDAVAVGWREEEAALQIADLADDYIMNLASRRLSRPMAANTNVRDPGNREF